ncbi:hypothetical protein OEZ85_012245 [Tetradesmus obliquus]|uniref:Exportin-T n=1 Tax=Tetradesmus obliquus TaxID=3088 RepID=A0ABY8TUV0_TETOB|nr:hypothetical protein OEZ85_012245 [Tetradesmus obliquus]
MSDDFEKAVLINFNYGGNINPQLKEQAAAYIASIKQSSDCWKLCCERFPATLYPEVKFWCLQTLHEVICACYLQLDEGSRQMIKGALLTWLQRDCTSESPALPPFLRNKLAQAIVAVVKREYPALWPSFFRELVAAAGSGPGLADMFGRIMVAVDEDVISLDIPRSAEETKLSMHLKDSMREQCIAEVAAAWFNLTQLYKASRPELAAFVLASAARYVHWMDIGLVANDRFIPLLGELMDHANPVLRGAATDVLAEVVSKRMEPTAKIALVQQLKVVDACERLSSNLIAAAGANKAAAAAALAVGECGEKAKQGGGAAGGGGAGVSAAALDQDDELLGKYAKLLATLASEVMDALKRVENVVISFNVTGLGVDDDAARDATLAAQAANRLLEALTRAALTAFCSGLDTISMPLVPFMSAYVARLRALTKRGQALPAGAQMHIQAVLEGVAAAARYPADGANEADDGSGGPGLGAAAAAAAGSRARLSDAEMLAAREEQWEVEERRRELLVLLKNAAKLAFPEALNFVAGKLQAVLAAGQAAAAGSSGQLPGSGSGAGSSGASFQDAEIAVTLLYELGEGAPDDALKPGSGGLGQLVLLLLTQGQALPAGQHRLVALAVLETCVRYCRVLQQEQSAIPAVLNLFVGPKGLGHPSPDVATRACYLLSRLVKTLRSNLKPYMDEMLRQLQPYLVVVATQPPPQGPAVGTAREASGKNLAPVTALVDDRLYVFESVGLLLGQEELPAEQQLAALHSLLQPLQRQIEGNLQQAAAEAGAGRGSGSSSSSGCAGLAQLGSGSWAILQAMEAIARLNKGFKWELCTRNRPQLGAAFLQCLEVSLAVPKALPGSKQLRARFIAFLHRMVESLMATVLPYLPAALEALMAREADVTDMTDVLTLLVQLITRFKEALGKLVEVVLPIAVARVHGLLGADWDWSGRLASPAAMAAAGQQSPQQQQQQVAVTLEDAREKGELQRGYYGLLHCVVHNNLAGSLLQASPQVLDSMLTALAKGASTHTDPAVRRVCVQVFVRLLQEWCVANGSELIPGFKSFAVQQLGGQALLGLFGSSSAAAASSNGSCPASQQLGPLDARDAATVALLGEMASALKLLQEKCGDAFSVHLCGQVLPESRLPGELQQQLAYHVRESEAKQLKEFLRELLLSAACASK